jgi:hypothetical protein
MLKKNYKATWQEKRKQNLSRVTHFFEGSKHLQLYKSIRDLSIIGLEMTT